MKHITEYVKSKIQEVEEEVRTLEIKVKGFTETLGVAHKRLEVLRDFDRMELQKDKRQEPSQPDIHSYHVDRRFINMTIREACQQILKEYGPLYVGEIYPILKAGGREVKRTSITSILIRGKEFARVLGKENTFKIKEDIEKGQPI